jgi:hypothetical protein
VLIQLIETRSLTYVHHECVLGRAHISYKIKRMALGARSLIQELAEHEKAPGEEWPFYSLTSLVEVATIIGMQPTKDCNMEKTGLLDTERTNHILVSYGQNFPDMSKYIHYVINYSPDGVAIISSGTDEDRIFDVGHRFICGWGRF